MDDMKIEGLFGDRPEPSRPHHSHHHYDESSYRRTIGNYYIGAALGEGGFSKVFLGEDRETGERVALKILKQRNQISTSMVRQVEREINAMSALGTDCPYIIGLKDVLYNAVYTKKNGQKQESMLIALELATGGELFEFLSFTGAFEEKLARTYFVQLIKGLEHCHRNGIAHRDLKPENILLSGDFILKLADFGFSHSFSKSNMNAMVTQCGTAGYMAPEMLHRSRTRAGYDGTKSDIWAAGVVLFIMIASFPPFQKPDTSDWWFQKLSVKKYSLFWQAHTRTAHFSELAQDLIVSILCPNPDNRITIEGIKAHPWCSGPTMSQDELVRVMRGRQKAVNYNKIPTTQTQQGESQLGTDKEEKRSSGMFSGGNGIDEMVVRSLGRAVKSTSLGYRGDQHNNDASDHTAEKQASSDELPAHPPTLELERGIINIAAYQGYHHQHHRNTATNTLNNINISLNISRSRGNAASSNSAGECSHSLSSSSPGFPTSSSSSSSSLLSGTRKQQNGQLSDLDMFASVSISPSSATSSSPPSLSSAMMSSLESSSPSSSSSFSSSSSSLIPLPFASIAEVTPVHTNHETTNSDNNDNNDNIAHSSAKFTSSPSSSTPLSIANQMLAAAVQDASTSDTHNAAQRTNIISISALPLSSSSSSSLSPVSISAAAAASTTETVVAEPPLYDTRASVWKFTHLHSAHPPQLILQRLQDALAAIYATDVKVDPHSIKASISTSQHTTRVKVCVYRIPAGFDLAGDSNADSATWTSSSSSPSSSLLPASAVAVATADPPSSSPSLSLSAVPLPVGPVDAFGGTGRGKGGEGPGKQRYLVEFSKFKGSSALFYFTFSKIRGLLGDIAI